MAACTTDDMMSASSQNRQRDSQNAQSLHVEVCRAMTADWTITRLNSRWFGAISGHRKAYPDF